MKKFAAITLVSLYALLSLGMQLHFHYCCGKLARVKFTESNVSCCSKQSAKSVEYRVNCCETQQLTLAIPDHHVPETFHLLVSEIPSFQNFTLSNLPEMVVNVWSRISPNTHGPPSSVPKYLEHVTLVYYG